MKKNDVQEFIVTASTRVAYDDQAKSRFHKQGTAVLKKLAGLLGCASGEFDVRSNRGGSASSGEITLHSDTLYVQFSQSALGDVFLWRTCKGRKDYAGGPNQWMKWTALENLEEVAAKMNAVANLSP